MVESKRDLPNDKSERRSDQNERKVEDYLVNAVEAFPKNTTSKTKNVNNQRAENSNEQPSRHHVLVSLLLHVQSFNRNINVPHKISD